MKTDHGGIYDEDAGYNRDMIWYNIISSIIWLGSSDCSSNWLQFFLGNLDTPSWEPLPPSTTG